jgi:hypothetical protein
MKTCPACSNSFAKRVKEACPICQTPLLLIKGTLRITEDKLIVDEVMLKIRTHIAERDHVEMPFGDSTNSREREFAYQLLERSKRFLAAQPTKLPVTPREFLLGLFDYILSIKWWAEKIETLRMLTNKIQNLAKDYFITLKQQYIMEQAEKKRMVIVKQNSMVIDYGL